MDEAFLDLESVEIELDEESTVTGRTLVDVISDLPAGVVIGAISRDGSLIAPRGETVFEAGDHVVMFVDATVLDEVVARF